MKTRLIYFWGLLQTSFWFIPLIIVFMAIGASFGLVYIDSIITYQPPGFFQFFSTGSADSARSILSTIAGAMLSVAGVVFSITLVALTLASSQFGSRLLRNFMHDRLNQTVLGTYIATFIFCLLVMRTVKSDTGIVFIPDISVIFAIVLAIGNIFLLIVFIHHISVSIQADQVISQTAVNLKNGIRRLFPEEEEKEETGKDNEKLANELKKTFPVTDIVINNNDGYIQSTHIEYLIRLAAENDLLISIDNRPGFFLTENIELARIYAKKSCDDEIKQRIRSAFILGNKRTPTQDAEFAIHQMVEIAARALSPGVNDPYTAITCIDKLTATMCSLTRACFPSPRRYDDDNNLRVIRSRPLTFSGMMDAAYNLIRQYGKNNPPVLIRLMEAFININNLARNREQKNAIDRHAEMVFKAANSALSELNDLNDLKERYDRVC